MYIQKDIFLPSLAVATFANNAAIKHRVTLILNIWKDV